MMLEMLNDAVAQLITHSAVHNLIDTLKQQLPDTSEPFVWSTLDPESVQLPEEIKSCWIFVLKKDVPSGCHYHPNSIQHMVMTEGKGTSKVGTESRQMTRFGQPECWYVIPEGTPHEFFPTEQDMVVISFHTCEADELEEVSCTSRTMRHYE